MLPAAAEEHGIPVCGFLGEECVTIELHPELEELHHRWGMGGALLHGAARGVGHAKGGHWCASVSPIEQLAYGIARTAIITDRHHMVLLHDDVVPPCSAGAGTTSRWLGWRSRWSMWWRAPRCASCSS